jgi:hypothetical protein
MKCRGACAAPMPSDTVASSTVDDRNTFSAVHRLQLAPHEVASFVPPVARPTAFASRIARATRRTDDVDWKRLIERR